MDYFLPKPSLLRGVIHDIRFWEDVNRTKMSKFEAEMEDYRNELNPTCEDHADEELFESFLNHGMTKARAREYEDCLRRESMLLFLSQMGREELHSLSRFELLYVRDMLRVGGGGLAPKRIPHPTKFGRRVTSDIHPSPIPSMLEIRATLLRAQIAFIEQEIREPVEMELEIE